MICTHCGRTIYPAGNRWICADPPRGPSMHAVCRGAKATQELIESSLAAMRFAGDFSPWKLVGDLYEPGEPGRPLGVQFDTHYGALTFEVCTDVIHVEWMFFASPVTRTSVPMVVTWTEPPREFGSDDDGRAGGADVDLPSTTLGLVVADILRAASSCMAASRGDGEP